MRHELPHCHRLTLARRNLEIEVSVDVLIEVDLPLLDLLHYRSPSGQLRNRSGPEQGPLGIDRYPLGDIGVAKPTRIKNLSVLDDNDDCARNVGGAQRVRQIAIEPSVEIRFIERGRRFGSCCRN